MTVCILFRHFTGLGAPYWNSEAKGALTGITRTTRKAEMVRAGGVLHIRSQMWSMP